MLESEIRSGRNQLVTTPTTPARKQLTGEHKQNTSGEPDAHLLRLNTPLLTCGAAFGFGRGTRCLSVMLPCYWSARE